MVIFVEESPQEFNQYSNTSEPPIAWPFTNLTPGAAYYLSPTVPGGITSTPPSSPGQIVQKVGFAKDATTLVFNLRDPLVVD